ncbi:hypothetical protein Ait01nite_091930 [Actinoplanes italicus]|uniref:MauE/DoxX family redox-associated membrane protein n=1 Tax=Actinoplanes italicus TaxID=113567 RepID=UPI001475E6D8|nr:MauE/DoxX family redox-associated membrane protein [Actinoplanes italicus]GIE36148.1 hypothetical protein Ait01nite_091930 [Actinoplanes italicus]
MRVLVATVVLLIAGVLVVSLAGKLRSRASLRAFADGLGDLRVIPGRLARPVAGVAVAAEAVTLGLLLWPGTTAAGMAAAALLFGGFTTALVIAVRRGSRAGCQCFGASSAPVAWRHVARSGCLGAAALAGLVAQLAVAAPPFSGAGGPQLVAAAGMATLGVGVLVWLDELAWLFGTTTPAR